MFIKTEHKVHVLHGLATCTFEKIIDNAGDEQFVVELLDVNKRFVGVDDLLEVKFAIDVVREGCRLIELAIEFDDILLGQGGIDAHDLRAKDASSEIATIRDEIQRGIKAWLQLSQRLLNLGHVLMAKSLVYRHITCSPREMSRGGRFAARG